METLKKTIEEINCTQVDVECQWSGWPYTSQEITDEDVG